MPTATTTDPATVNRDRRAWLAAAIVRERDGFGRAGAVQSDASRAVHAGARGGGRRLDNER